MKSENTMSRVLCVELINKFLNDLLTDRQVRCVYALVNNMYVHGRCTGNKENRAEGASYGISNS